LTNLPDYTFKDGRPTPLGTRQKTRLDKQRGYAVCKTIGLLFAMKSCTILYSIDFQAKIVKLVGEIDYAVERHARLQEKEKEERQKILNNKLKPKGNLLLQKREDTIEK